MHLGGQVAPWVSGAGAADPEGVFAREVFESDFCAHFSLVECLSLGLFREDGLEGWRGSSSGSGLWRLVV